MLIAAYVEMTSLAKREAGWARVFCELNEQIKDELKRTQQLHEEILVGLTISSKEPRKHLEEA